MGVVTGISHDQFPKQGSWNGRRVNVCFNFDTTNMVGGIIVRDDMEEPGRTIIKLDNDRYVLATECQYSVVPEIIQEVDGEGIDEGLGEGIDEGEDEEQSFPDGSCVKFLLRPDQASDFESDNPELITMLEHNSEICIIDNLETFTQIGNPDFEYYNVRFGDAAVLTGISGLYLYDLPEPE